DLAVSNDTTSGTIPTLRGNGDGTFAAAVNYAAGNSPQFMAAIDLNGDNKLDLVVASYNSGVGVLLNQTSGPGAFTAGSFALVVFTGTGGNPYPVATGDFNGDGKIGLAVTNYSGNHIATLHRNDNAPFG